MRTTNMRKLLYSVVFGSAAFWLALMVHPRPALSLAPAAQSEFNDQFGHALASGDFNNDSFMDLVVGAPYEDVEDVESAGVIFLYDGAETGLTAAGVFANAFGGLGGNEPYDRFGWALASGDFNGDDIDDLAVSAPWEAVSDDPEQSGAIFIYHGSDMGLVPAATYHQENIGLTTANERGDRFGAALAAGDFDRNGFDDLAVGAPGERPGASEGGAVFVLSSGKGGMTAFGTILTSADLVRASPLEQFGSALAAGNFIDTDSLFPPYDDLAVGCYNCLVDGEHSGAVFLYEGHPAALQPRMRLTQWTWDEEMDDFGRAIAIADFNMDGWEDIAAGAPGENGATGYVFHWQSTGSGLDASQALTQEGYALGERKDRFGATLLAESVAGNSVSDLLVGVPREAPGSDLRSGVVDLYRGNVGQELSQPSWFDQGYLDDNDPDDYFGKALAAADFDNDGCIEIAVGAPGEEVLGASRAGTVYVFDCTPSGPAGWLVITQENITNVNLQFLPWLPGSG